MAKIKRRKFCLMYKLKILKEIELGASIRYTAKKYDIAEKSIREWRKKKYFIEGSTNKLKKCRVDYDEDKSPSKFGKYKEIESGKKWNDWFINSPKSFTNGNNMRSPGYANLITWLSDIWENISCELIEKSFDVCGITSNQYHSELSLVLNGELINEAIDDDNNDYDDCPFFELSENEISDEDEDDDDNDNDDDD